MAQTKFLIKKKKCTSRNKSQVFPTEPNINYTK